MFRHGPRSFSPAVHGRLRGVRRKSPSWWFVRRLKPLWSKPGHLWNLHLHSENASENRANNIKMLQLVTQKWQWKFHKVLHLAEKKDTCAFFPSFLLNYLFLGEKIYSSRYVFDIYALSGYLLVIIILQEISSAQKGSCSIHNCHFQVSLWGRVKKISLAFHHEFWLQTSWFFTSHQL